MVIGQSQAGYITKGQNGILICLDAHHAACCVTCRTFREIASTEGSKSMDKKKGLIQKLVVGSRQNETGYIMRALQGKLRIGLAEQTVLVALAHAVLLHRQGDRDKDDKLAGQLEEAAQAVKYVYSQCPSYDQLVPALLKHPVSVSPPDFGVHPCAPAADLCLAVSSCEVHTQALSFL